MTANLQTMDPAETKTAAAAPLRQPLPYAAVFLIRVGVTAAALWVLLTFVIGVTVCHTAASYPMIKDGDLCLTFRPAALMPGDATVYRYEGETRIGRVVALAGDTVTISDGILSVNGEGVMIPTVYPTMAEGSVIRYPYTVPENSVFILNDYRDDTADSRSIGGVPLSDCQGRVIFLMRRRGI